MNKEYWKKEAFIDYDENAEPTVKSVDGVNEIPLSDFIVSNDYDGVAGISSTMAYAINLKHDIDESLTLYCIG